MSWVTAFLRRKRINQDRQQLHSEWDRRLGPFSVSMIAAILAMVFSLHLILPGLFASRQIDRRSEANVKDHEEDNNNNHSLGAPLLALALVSLIILLGAQQLAAASRRIAVNGPVYQLAHGLAGQGAAFCLAWAQLLNFVCALALCAHSLSEHTNLLFHNAVRDHLHFRWPQWRLPWWPPQQQSVDLFAPLLPLAASLIMLCSLRVLLTVSTIFLVAALFTTASTGTVALLHNIAQLRATTTTSNQQQQQQQIGGGGESAEFAFFQAVSPDQVLADARWLLLAWIPVEALSFLAAECSQPRRTLPPQFGHAARGQALLTLVALLAFFPFLQQLQLQQQQHQQVQHQQTQHQMIGNGIGTSNINFYWNDSDDSGNDDGSDSTSSALLLTLPLLFNTIRLFSARYLMGVGSVCALCAALLCLFVPATRLLVLLVADRLLGPPLVPKCLRRLAKKGGQPRCAVLLVALICSASLLAVPRPWLVLLLPLNLTLLLIAQAILLFLAHFLPGDSDNSLDICPPRYSRVLSEEDNEFYNSSEDEEENYDDEEEEEEAEEEEGTKEVSSSFGPIELENGRRQHRLGREERESSEKRLMEKTTKMPCIDSSRKVEDNAGQRLLERQLLLLGRASTSSYSSLDTVLRHQSVQQFPKTKFSSILLDLHQPQQLQQQQQQHWHNCLHSPCCSSSSTNANFPASDGLHIYEQLDATNNSKREESGSRAAASLDEEAAWTRAKWAGAGIGLLALLCAFSLKALRETREYTPMLALLALLISVPLAGWIAIWAARTRVDWTSSAAFPSNSADPTATTTTSSTSSALEESKWLPLGSLCSMFLLIQVAFLFPAAEHRALALWNLLGLIVYTLCQHFRRSVERRRISRRQ